MVNGGDIDWGNARRLLTRTARRRRRIYGGIVALITRAPNSVDERPH
jgi:hypothetical protein